MKKEKHIITRDRLDYSGPDSGLGHWNRYRGVHLEKTVETDTQVYNNILYGFNTISY
jgi:hypothetical protein